MLTACGPNHETVNRCEVRPETQYSNFALSEADLQGVDLSGANLTGAIMRAAYLSEVKYNANTKFPEGFDPEAGAWRMTWTK